MKYFLALITAVAALSASQAYAAEKVAVFDLRKAVFSTDEAKKRAEKLKNSSDTKALTTKIENLNSELQTLNEEGQKNRMTWSAEQGAEHKNKMEYKLKERQIAINKLQQMDKALMQELFKELGPKADKAVRDVIDANGITLLLKAEAAHWFTTKTDITADVTTKLNGK